MAKAIRTCQADTQTNRLARERHTHIYKESGMQMKWNWLESKSKLSVSPTALESNQSLQICTRMYTFVLQACVPTAAHINNSFVTLNLFQFICSKWQIMRYNYISWIAAQGSRALMRAPIFNEILCYLCAFFQQTRLPVRPRVCVCVCVIIICLHQQQRCVWVLCRCQRRSRRRCVAFHFNCCTICAEPETGAEHKVGERRVEKGEKKRVKGMERGKEAGWEGDSGEAERVPTGIA